MHEFQFAEGLMQTNAMIKFSVTAGLLAAMATGYGQQPAATPAPATPATTAPAADATQSPAATTTDTAAPAATTATDTPAAGPAAAKGAVPAKPAATADKKSGFLGIGKGKPAPYTGPTEIVVLPPTPMLDAEGRQMLDPDAKPMFNPPVKQQRDKFGHPLFDAAGKPVFQTAKELGYDEHGKKIAAVKEKPVKQTPATINRGTFAVDGIVGKAALNYDIADLKYIYEFVPGMGVAVVSNMPFPGAKEQPGAFNDKLLTISVMDHTLEISSEKPILNQKKPSSAYVLIDRDFTLPSRYPVVGYGTLRAAPYMWPGAKPNAAIAGVLAAPPVPKGLQPQLLLKPCPAGMMRPPSKSLPGEPVVEQPCVPIPKGTAAVTAKTGTPAATGAVAPPKQ